MVERVVPEIVPYIVGTISHKSYILSMLSICTKQTTHASQFRVVMKVLTVKQGPQPKQWSIFNTERIC